MSNRFFLDPATSTREGDAAVLRGDEAHHFARVMRGRVGDEIFLFDGRGISFRGVVESVHKDAVGVHVLETIHDRIESPLRLTVGTALPKGDRQGFLVEKLAELGVARLVPLRLERSVAKGNDAAILRLRRRVVEAAKQCGRNVLMEIAGECSLDEFDDLLNDETKYVLHPVSLGAVGQVSPKHILNERLPKRIALLIGPEGSFTEKEVAAALKAGFTPLDLGARILRTETACIAAAALLLTYAG